MRFVRPALEWKEEHEAYIQEWGGARITPSSLNLTKEMPYKTFLENLAMRESGAGKWMPCTSYFVVNEADRIVGMVDIRHELNEHMLQVGGHIGYSVRPSERRKGYATSMLSVALKKTDALHINPVLITCNADNIASAKVILSNNGVEDESFTEDHGTVVRRFWIERISK